MAYKDREKQRAYARAYYIKNKEEVNRKNREWYQKNKADVCLRTNKYFKRNLTKYKQYKKKSYGGIKLEVFAKIDPAMKCANCGCDDTRFLEVNHIKGGGRKEQKSFKKKDHNVSTNFVMLILRGKRGVEDLNLLCRVCNSIDHLERVYGKTGLSVVWDKEKMKLSKNED